MPIYVYGCATCSHQFEQMQRFQDEPLKTCPECGAPIRKLVQPVGIVFKGSGWYSTDSRASASKNGKAPNDTAAASGDSGIATEGAAATDTAKDTTKSDDKPKTAAAATPATPAK